MQSPGRPDEETRGESAPPLRRVQPI